MFIVCGGYESRCYLIFVWMHVSSHSQNNIIMILLSIAELVGAGLYFIPDKAELVKKILDLPESVGVYMPLHS